jgi:drug/metabolite transporter (DMT)-like permease
MQTRQLRKRVYFQIVPFYQSIFSAFIAPLLMMIFLRYRTAHTTHYGWLEISLIVVISVLQYISQVFATKAYQVDKAGRVAPVNQLQIICNWVLDFVLIGTIPTTHELIGGIMIVGSQILISFLRFFNIIK